MFTVIFRKKSYNQHISYAQNCNRYIGSKSFKTLNEAQAYAQTVDTKHIINNIGEVIKF